MMGENEVEYQEDNPTKLAERELDKARASGDPDTFYAAIRKLEALQQKKQAPSASVTPEPRPSSNSTNISRSRAAQSQIPRKARPAPAPSSPNPDQIPTIWGDAYRGLPNDLIRTGLFNIRRNEPRALLQDVRIAAMRNTVMLYSGEELRIKDEDVLMQVYHFQRAFRLGAPWCVNGRDFLSAMRWTDGQRGYLELYASLRRLSKGHLTVIRSGAEPNDFVLRAGTLLSDLEIEHSERGGPRRITVIVNPRTGVLWESMGYTLVNWVQRLELTSPLARFLHRFYSSHQEPFALKVETVLSLTGSTTSSRAKFRQLLRDALQSLVTVGFLGAFWIDTNDLVHVRRNQSLLSA